jgi:signal transduction histidine kinase/ActR/RegA family two-component response regulator
MDENKTLPPFIHPPLDETDTRIRVVTLNLALAIAILTTLYFGIHDLILLRLLPAAFSFTLIFLFVMMLWLNIRVPRFRTIFDIVFICIIGMTFLALLMTQFPDPAIVLWCFPFPLLAVFLLGRRRGRIALVLYNLGVIAVFVADILLRQSKYDYEYAIRYGGVMVVISILAFYYESLRIRSLDIIRTANQILEQRIEEKSRALEESRERLHQSEKLEAIGLLAGGIAHDFNNQLTGIMAFAELIQAMAKDNAEIRDCAEGILAASRRSSELTGQLLAFARKGNILAIPVDIHQVVGEVISLLSHTIDKRISIHRKFAAHPSMVLGDPTRLENALLNLALNARDSMPSGGAITFATENVTLGEAFCKMLHSETVPGDYVHIRVSDTGCGMDRKTLNRIFEPFFTTKERGKGSGMGLPSVYGTVLSHKGAVTVDSEPGKGSAFHMYLPLLKDAAVTPAGEAQTAPVEKCLGHILLIDDEEIVAESIKRLLVLLGYTVTLCRNGREAIDFYTGSWRSVDIVILDMVMPVMSGGDTFLAMKKINPEIVAFIASGYSLDGEARSILDCGAKGFMQKPFDISELRKRLSAFSNKQE